jgi:tRNA (guanine-N(7)-)-methyltransferase subunit TRM82
MQPSFHIVKHLENTNLILFVVGNILSLIDQKGAVELTFKNEIVRERIRTVAFHSKRRILAISTNDKMLVLLDLKGNVINTRKLFKKATCLVFDETGTNILMGDKFGDCYSFSVDNDELKPILLFGHVSILTDLKLTGKFLISSDRDEKIRINMYPNTYDIHRFCLGHSEYVLC